MRCYAFAHLPNTRDDEWKIASAIWNVITTLVRLAYRAHAVCVCMFVWFKYTSHFESTQRTNVAIWRRYTAYGWFKLITNEINFHRSQKGSERSESLYTSIRFASHVWYVYEWYMFFRSSALHMINCVPARHQDVFVVCATFAKENKVKKNRGMNVERAARRTIPNARWNWENSVYGKKNKRKRRKKRQKRSTK